jgi:hypothetical protein
VTRRPEPGGERRAHRGGRREDAGAVGRHRVESAAVHDPRARAGGDIMAAVDAVPDEQHLTGQVA